MQKNNLDLNSVAAKILKGDKDALRRVLLDVNIQFEVDTMPDPKDTLTVKLRESLSNIYETNEITGGCDLLREASIWLITALDSIETDHMQLSTNKAANDTVSGLLSVVFLGGVMYAELLAASKRPAKKTA